MTSWGRVVEAFKAMKPAKHRKCLYHYGQHYADVSAVRNGRAIYLYHDVKIAEHNTITLRITHQGYYTQTTRDRLNAILSVFGLPYSVSLRLQRDGYTWWPVAMLLSSEKGTYLFDREVEFELWRRKCVTALPRVLPTAPSWVRDWLKNSGYTRVKRNTYVKDDVTAVLGFNSKIIQFRYGDDREDIYTFNSGFNCYIKNSGLEIP